MAQESRLAITIDSRSAEQKAKELEQALGAMEAAGIRVVGSSRRVSGGLVGVGGVARTTAASVDGLNKELAKTEQQAATSAATINRVLKSALLGFSTMRLIDMADEWGQYASRMRMATESQDEYNHAQSRMAQSAQTTFRAINETREAFIQLSPVLREMGLSLDQSIDAVDAFSGLLVVNGANAERGAAAMEALGKSFQRGRVDADAWMTIYSTADTIVQHLADSTGKAAEEIRQLGVEGKISAEMMAKALLSAYAPVMKQVEGMPTTVRDALTNLNTAFGEYIGKANESSQVTATLASGIGIISKNFAALADVLGYVAAGTITLYVSRTLGAASASVQAAAASYTKGRAALAEAKAEAQATAATLASTQANLGLKATHIQLAAAKVAEEAATKRLAAAQAASVGAGRALLGVLGGPVGLGVTAALAAGSFLLFSSNANAAEKSADDFRGSVDLLTASLDKMGASALGNAKLKIEDELISLGQTIAVTKIKLESLGSQMNAIPDKNSPLYKQMYRQMMDLAQSYEETRGRADGLRAQLEKIAGLLSAPISVGGDQTSQAFAKFESQIDRQIALIGKSGAAVQLRYDLEKGLLGEMSDAEQKRAREKIDTLEASERAEEARRKAAGAGIKQEKETVRLIKALQDQVAVLGMADTEMQRYQLRMAGATESQLKAADALLATKDAFEKAKEAQDAYKSLILDLRTEEERTTDLLKERVRVLREAGLSADQYASAMQRVIKGGISVAPKFDGIDASVGGASGELVRVAQARSELDKWRAEEMQRHQQYLNQKLISEQEHADAVLEISRRYNEQQSNLSDAWKSASLASFASVTGDAAEMLRTLGHEGSVVYKAMFLASKAASIAQAIINTEIAATRALAELGPIAGPPMAATMRGLGYASVGMIAATALTGMAHSGIDQIPREGTWLLDKGERVLSPRQNSDLTSYLKKANTVPAGAEGSGQPIHINVEVNIANDGSTQTQVGGAGAQQGRQLAEMVAGMVQQGLAREMRQGGLLWNQRNGYLR
ncbi:tape measure protein [Alcaligenes sp. SDU_A2]|uniref:tape measure protein n=1 Tax=Alcaligenes sp. SDU_A2 TaxID=3136634 RepID=UPI00311F59A0